MYHLGNQSVSFQDILGDIKNSYLNESIQVLKERLEQDGYLCVRGLIPRENILAARKVMYDQMLEDNCLSPNSTMDLPRGKGESFLGKKHVTHHSDFLSAVEHCTCFDFFQKIFGEPALTFDHKWCRAVPEHAAGTQAHMDIVYMGRGSKNVLTMWIPMGDIPRENGPMVVLEKSHLHPSLQKIRDTYGKMDVDRDLVKGGWFSNNYKELSDLTGTKWLVGDYEAGDVIIMPMTTFHGSLRNEMPLVRFTCDVRFQPASETVDERWVGENPIGHAVWWKANADKRTVDIAVARKEWGV